MRNHIYCFVAIIVVALLLPSATSARFTSIDPKASKYPSVSPYVYTLDNPMKFVDPEGEKIEFAPGSSDAYKRQFQVARDYAKTHGVTTIEDLDAIPEVVNVTKTDNLGGDRFQSPGSTRYRTAGKSSNAILYWNPNSALETTSGGKQSPTVGLVHECGHALLYFKDPKQYTKDYSANTNQQYGNRLEGKVTTLYENPAATLLGEATRQDNLGTPYKVLDPTSTTKLTDQQVRQIGAEALKIYK